MSPNATQCRPIGGLAWLPIGLSLIGGASAHQHNSGPLASPTEVYDYSKSTAENYAQPNARLRREFFSTRAGLDYTYHTRYSLERQALQDEIIRSMLSYEDMQRGLPSRRSELDRMARGGGAASRLRQPERPWAIFTAGCMGAGKTHVMCALDRHGLLPLPHFVRVDVDRIRELLPETQEYIRRDAKSAGHLTQQEAGLIAEVVSEEALSRGLNIWVDSSLRDADWWSTELQRVRRSYPHKLAILRVDASWDRVQDRADRRAEITGRRIPLQVLKATFKRVPAAITQLRELVDEFIDINNNGEHPKLKASRDTRALIRVCRDVGGDCESRHLESWLPGLVD